MQPLLRILTPPPGTVFHEGREVTKLVRTPDHSAYYVSRRNAPTRIVRKDDLDTLEVREVG